MRRAESSSAGFGGGGPDYDDRGSSGGESRSGGPSNAIDDEIPF